jgi:hypothetical protein
MFSKNMFSKNKDPISKGRHGPVVCIIIAFSYNIVYLPG